MRVPQYLVLCSVMAVVTIVSSHKNRRSLFLLRTGIDKTIIRAHTVNLVLSLQLCIYMCKAYLGRLSLWDTEKEAVYSGVIRRWSNIHHRTIFMWLLCLFLCVLFLNHIPNPNINGAEIDILAVHFIKEIDTAYTWSEKSGKYYPTGEIES